MWMTAVVKLFAKIRLWHRRRRAIMELAAIDERLLRDIGLHRGAIRQVVDSQLRKEKAPPAKGGQTAKARRLGRVPQGATLTEPS